MGEPYRVLPRVTALDRDFWTGGEHGELRIQRCGDCGFYNHPPKPRCVRCMGHDVAAEPVSGRGTVYAHTLNYQPWNPTYDHPYVIAVVELDEQADLRVTTNIVDCDPESVHIGMPVEVTFVQDDDVWLPMFTPQAEDRGAGGE